MANVYVKTKIMPTSPETDLDKIRQEIEKILKSDGSILHKYEVEPIAFGLESLNIVFMRDEKKGDTEELEKEFNRISGVESVETVDVRRAFG